MSKVLFTADVHFGVPGRLQDILWSARVMREYAKRHGIDTVVILGDLFHDRRSLDIEVLCVVYDFFTEAKALGQNWIIFPGNHDMFLKHSWKVNSLKPLSGLLTIIDTIKVLQLDEVRFWVVPFIHLEAAYMRAINHVEKIVTDGDMLLTHIGVRGATLNTCFLLKDWSVVDFAKTAFERVYTGHFHSTQSLDKVWYPGSPIPFKFDEGDVEHGFFVFDTEKRDHEFMNIWTYGLKYFPDEVMPPKFSTFHDTLLDSKDPGEIKDTLVRIACTREYTQGEKAEIRASLVEQGARGVRFFDTIVEESVEISEAQKGLLQADTLFDTFVEADTKGTKDLRKNLLRRLNDEIISEGDEIYNKKKLEV